MNLQLIREHILNFVYFNFVRDLDLDIRLYDAEKHEFLWILESYLSE